MLLDLLGKNPNRSTLVFCNTTARANSLHQQLTEDPEVLERLTSLPSLLHGSIPEKQRQSVLNHFMLGNIKILICTDLASRGIDTTKVPPPPNPP